MKSFCRYNVYFIIPTMNHISRRSLGNSRFLIKLRLFYFEKVYQVACSTQKHLRSTLFNPKHWNFSCTTEIHFNLSCQLWLGFLIQSDICYIYDFLYIITAKFGDRTYLTYICSMYNAFDPLSWLYKSLFHFCFWHGYAWLCWTAKRNKKLKKKWQQ